MAEWGDDPEGRREWFYGKLRNNDGRIPHEAFLKASRYRRALEREQRAIMRPPVPGSVNWVPLGPAAIPQGQASGNPTVSGRITALAVGPGGQRAYAGTANGGVWVSEDAGDSWKPIDEYAFINPPGQPGLDANSLAVGSIAVAFGATQANDTIFVGTGEANNSSDSYFGIGIKCYTNGGAVTTLEALNLASKQISKIAIDPDDPTIVLAATTTGIYKRPPSPGPYDNWIDACPVGVVLCYTDVIVAGRQATNNKAYYCAVQGYGVWKSTDLSTAWQRVNPTLPNPARIALAASESNPSVIYAFCSDATLYRTSNWRLGNVAAVQGVPADVVGSQGTYDLTIAVDPKDENTVYLGGAAVPASNNTYNLALYKCTVLSGDTASPSLVATFFGNGVHADAHAIAFATNADGTHDPNIVWVGTDGGPFSYSPGPGSDLATFSKTGRGNFRARNIGLNVTQLNYLDHRPDTDAVVYAGSQDNGTIRFIGEPAWLEAPKGDGGGVAVDPKSVLNVMRQYVRGILYRCTDGGLADSSWSVVPFLHISQWTNPPSPPSPGQTENDRTGFYAPLKAIVDSSSNKTIVAFGTFRLWITTDGGDNWVTLPSYTDPLATGNLTTDMLGASPDSVRAISFVSSRQIYVATSSGIWSIVRAVGSGLSGPWQAIPVSANYPMPNGIVPNITALCVEDPATGSFYLGLGGQGVDHVWYFNAQTNTWTSAGNVGLTQAYLDVPVHAIVVDPANTNTLYIATAIGVWKGVKSTASPPTWSWNIFSQGLPECTILDLAIHAKGRVLRAATHGRGAWEIPLDATADHDPDIYLRTNYADSGRMIATGRQPWVDGVPDPAIWQGTSQHSLSADIKVNLASNPQFHMGTTNLSPIETSTGPFNYVDFAQLSATAGTLQQFGTNQIIIQLHNRRPNAYAKDQVSIILLLADATNQIPPLPGNYADQLANTKSQVDWLAGSGWQFAYPYNRYLSPRGDVSAYSPQLVTYDVDLNTDGLTGASKICAAIFAIVPNESIISGFTDISQLALKDKHVAYRLLPVSPNLPGTQAGTADLPYWGHSATLLPSGKVLVAGGDYYGINGNHHMNDTQIYDPATKTWSPGPSMAVGRSAHSATLLNDGRVLVVGGLPTLPNPGPMTEILDPAITPMSWTPVAPMKYGRWRPAVAILPDGKVLVAGGSGPPAPCEIFDPNNMSNPWTELPNCLLGGWSGSFAVLPSGQVFLFAGDPAIFQIFDPATQTLIPTANPQSKFLAVRMTALPSGDMLVSGDGQNEMEQLDPRTSVHWFRTMTCELFSPGRNSWRTIRTKFPVARVGFYDPMSPQVPTLLDDGRVLFSGSEQLIPPVSTIIYDPVRCVWMQSPPLASGRISHTATALMDGTVLLVGGHHWDYPWPAPKYSAELYTPPSSSYPVVLAGSI
jgi:hypothetical protein